MRSKLLPLLMLLLSGTTTGAALAAPTLRTEVTVSAPVVTVGDMFADAGALAAEPLFRAPPLGTSGVVTTAEIGAAAARLGLTDYSAGGITTVRVSRPGALVDEALLADLIVDDLRRRRLLEADMQAEPIFETAPAAMTVEASSTPARLLELRYLPGRSSFTARVELAGRTQPLEVSGRVEISMAVPHLAANLPAGAILTAADVELRNVPLQLAETGTHLRLEDVVGMQLQRSSRGGVMLKASDLGQPQLIVRNDDVTIYYRQGPLTLTVKGQALNSAVAGAPVSVLNTMSNRVITGIALGKGAVEIRAPYALGVAGLQ